MDQLNGKALLKYITASRDCREGMPVESNAVVMGLEQGFIALLGSKATAALLPLSARPETLILICLSAILVQRSATKGCPVAWRVSAITTQVLQTIALNTVFHWATSAVDTLLASSSLLAVYFVARAFQPGADVTVTAQYLFVSRLSQVLSGFHRGEVLAAAWVLAFGSGGILPADETYLAQLVTVDSLSAWLRGWLPHGLLLPTTTVILYLCAPFSEDFPVLQRAYRFAVFAFTNDATLAHTPAWLLTSAIWALWRVDRDPVSKRLLAIAGTNLAIIATLDALRFAIDDDPAPTLLALLVTIKILEEAAGRQGQTQGGSGK